MSRYLFVTWDGGGNVGPAVEIAKELLHRGEKVRFLGQEQQREAIERVGFDFTAYSKPGSWTATDKRGALKNAVGFLSLLVGRGLGRDLVTTLKTLPADLIVIDCLLFGALDAAARAGLRHAVLVHSLYAAIDTTMAGGAPGAVARLAGLNPRKLWAGADLVIAATLEELDRPPRPGTGLTLKYTGPTLPEITPNPVAPLAPTILVSLSTTYIAGQTEVLQKVLDAISDLPVKAIVTTGPAVDPTQLRTPTNTELHRFLPHAEVMPTVSLVIGHGGHSTTMLALAHDLPLLIVPINLMFDQPLIGQTIQKHGAGLTLASSSTPAQIREAVERMLTDTKYQREATRLGAAIRATSGTQTAATRLQALALQFEPHP